MLIYYLPIYRIYFKYVNYQFILNLKLNINKTIYKFLFVLKMQILKIFFRSNAKQFDAFSLILRKKDHSILYFQKNI